MPSFAAIAALCIAQSTVRLFMSTFTTTGTRCHDSTDFHWRGQRSTRIHSRSQILIHACTQHNPCGARRRKCRSRDGSLAFSRPAVVSVSRASSPNEVIRTCLVCFSRLSHLSSTVRGCPLELTHLSELRHTCGLAKAFAYSSQRGHAVHSSLASRVPSHDQRLSTQAYCGELSHQLSCLTVLARSLAVSSLPRRQRTIDLTYLRTY